MRIQGFSRTLWKCFCRTTQLTQRLKRKFELGKKELLFGIKISSILRYVFLEILWSEIRKLLEISGVLFDEVGQLIRRCFFDFFVVVANEPHGQRLQFGSRADEVANVEELDCILLGNGSRQMIGAQGHEAEDLVLVCRHKNFRRDVDDFNRIRV